MPGTPLKEIFARFGIDFDDKKVKEGAKSVTALTGQIRQLGTALAGGFIVRGISNFISQTAAIGDEIGKTATQVGLTVEQFQAFRHAAELGGVDGAAFTNSLRQLQSRAVQASRDGGRMAQMFQDLGVDVHDATGEVKEGGILFRDVAQAISEVENPSLRTNFAMELMGRAGGRLLPLLNQGAEGLDNVSESFERLGGFSQEAVVNSEAFVDSMTNFRATMAALRSRIAVVILPAIGKFVDTLTDLSVAFREVTEQSHFMQVAIVTLAGVMVAAGASVLAAWLPQMLFFGLLAAALLVVVLAVDDLIVAFQGGDSVISNLTDELLAHMGVWFRFKNIVDEVKGSLQDFIDAWHVAGGFISGLTGGAGRTEEESAASGLTGAERGATGTGQAIRRLFGGETPETAADRARESRERARAAQTRARRERRAELAATGAEAREGEVRSGAPIIGEGGRILGRQQAQVMQGGQWVNIGETNVSVNVQASGVNEEEVARRAARSVERTIERNRRETVAALGASTEGS